MIIDFSGGEAFDTNTGTLLFPDGSSVIDLDGTPTPDGIVFFNGLATLANDFSKITYGDGSVSSRVQEGSASGNTSTLPIAIALAVAIWFFARKRL